MKVHGGVVKLLYPRSPIEEQMHSGPANGERAEMK